MSQNTKNNITHYKMSIIMDKTDKSEPNIVKFYKKIKKENLNLLIPYTYKDNNNREFIVRANQSSFEIYREHVKYMDNYTNQFAYIIDITIPYIPSESKSIYVDHDFSKEEPYYIIIRELFINYVETWDDKGFIKRI